MSTALNQPTATLAAAVVTFLAVLGGLVVQTLLALKALKSTNANAAEAVRQRDAADRLDAQWDRIRWAVDLLLGEDWRGVEVAHAALEDLAADPRLTELDLMVVQAALQAWAAGAGGGAPQAQ